MSRPISVADCGSSTSKPSSAATSSHSISCGDTDRPKPWVNALRYSTSQAARIVVSLGEGDLKQVVPDQLKHDLRDVITVLPPHGGRAETDEPRAAIDAHDLTHSHPTSPGHGTAPWPLRSVGSAGVEPVDGDLHRGHAGLKHHAHG
jgi:hypothetical protein